MQRRLLDQFKTWERASVVGAIFGLTWVAYRAAPIVFGHRELTPQEIGGAIGGALGCLLISLWVWGTTDVFPVLDAQERDISEEEETETTVGEPVVWLLAGGLEAAVRQFPQSLAYLGTWPSRRLKG